MKRSKKEYFSFWHSKLPSSNAESLSLQVGRQGVRPEAKWTPFFLRLTFQIIISIFCTSILISCKEEIIPYSNNNCKANAPFIARLGFNAGLSYFSTSEKRTMGLVLIEANNKSNLAEGKAKQYQDSSWKQAGWLAPIQIDDKGNVFTGPAPFINVLNKFYCRQRQATPAWCCLPVKWSNR